MEKKKLGKYELLSPLGSGATAEVYRARDTVLGREVALKVLKPALVADPSAFERFVKEAQAAAGLFHDHIATVLDMGEADGRYFIAMRYIPGQSLDKVLAEKGPLSWEETLRMAKQIGAALDFAHEQGFLHRDIKPSNIIRTLRGDYVLTDFGLQRAMMSTGLTSHTGAILGTPPYIAPEIWDGKPAVAATDQYALACVVYETLTGMVLFAGETPMAVLKRHLEGWARPAKWPEGVPEGIEPVLIKAFAKEPEERFQKMGEFAIALEELVAVDKAQKAGSVGRVVERKGILSQAQEGARVDRVGEAQESFQPKETADALKTASQSAEAAPAPTKVSTPPAHPPRKRIPGWVWAIGTVVVGGGLIVLLLVLFLSLRNGLLTAEFFSSPTPSATNIFAPTLPKTNRPTLIPTNTPTPTITQTFTPTFTPTSTPTSTPKSYSTLIIENRYDGECNYAHIYIEFSGEWDIPPGETISITVEKGIYTIDARPGREHSTCVGWKTYTINLFSDVSKYCVDREHFYLCP